MHRVFPPAVARISNSSVPLQAAVCCRNLCPQQPTMAELPPELLQDGDKDMRGALRGGQALAMPTKFPLFTHCFPCCLPVSVDTCHSRNMSPSALLTLSPPRCHLSLPTPNSACQIPTFFTVVLQCRLHAAASGPSPEESSRSPCVRRTFVPLSQHSHVFLSFCPSRSCLISPKRL